MGKTSNGGVMAARALSPPSNKHEQALHKLAFCGQQSASGQWSIVRDGLLDGLALLNQMNKLIAAYMKPLLVSRSAEEGWGDWKWQWQRQRSG